MNENKFEQEPQLPDSNDQEQPKDHEQEEVPFERLPESLGFSETEELKNAGLALIEAYKQKDPEECKRLISEYEELAIIQIDQAADPKDRARREIGFNIALGLIREAGGAESSGESFETAYNHAREEDFGDIIAALEKAFG